CFAVVWRYFMAFNRVLKTNKKGQIAIEFILLLVVMLVYIQTIIQPVLDTSYNATDDVTRLAQTRNAAQKLVNAIDYSSLSVGDASQQIRVFVPGKSSVGCNSLGEVNFSIVLNSTGVNTVCDFGDTDGDVSKCSKTLKTVATILTCAALTSTGSTIEAAENKGRFVKLNIRKAGSTISVQEAT
ncbi:MAG: hypothetical protein Q7K42_02845, partial [Candidatus Diapherotrites archaeon]|nr:hypothetical protein [Candidatus Diapherotrites archaeon]